MKGHLLGEANESKIFIAGIETSALIDTGAMISSMSEEFYNSLDPKPTLQSLTDFRLDVYGADGNLLPYSGYVEIEICLPFIEKGLNTISVPILVTPTTEYREKVPVIIGTNVIRVFRDQEETFENLIPDPWKLAFDSMKISKSIPVKTTNKFPLTIGPNQVKTVQGLVRNTGSISTVVTEQEGSHQCGNIVVCPRVVSLEGKSSKTARIPVRICNLSATAVKIPPKSFICSVNEVRVLDGWSPEKSSVCESDITNTTHGLDVKVNSEGFSEDQCEQVDQVLTKWKHIFSTSFKDLGNTNLVKHEIKLTDDIPFKEQYRRIPPAMYEEVRQHLREMLEAGAIRKSSSPYCSNVVLCRKSDGTLRFCIDLRKLNNKTIKDSYSLPRVEDTMDSLIGSKYFSKLDLRSGYWQVELKEEDKHKTAFTVGPLGFFECNRMPFGLTNAPATFQRLMESCMGELHLKECLIFLDDILIFSRTFEEHLSRLEGVFERLEQHNLKLKPSKCEFFMKEVKYLGHVVSEQGIRTDPEKVEALKSWPVPHNIKTLRSFLGFTGYYRKFVKDYSKIVKPLNDLLVGHPTHKAAKKRAKVPWVWGEKQQSAFNQIVEKLTSPPILAYADFSKPFIVNTDASSEGLGAVLYQVQEGYERVIAYASRGLRPSERNYPAHKLEFLCLKWALCDKFHDYLYGNTFEVRTDNNPLTYVTTTAKLDVTSHRWLASLSNYNFSLSYRRGKANNDADGLSRRPYAVKEVFPEVIKALSQATLVNKDTFAFAETVVVSENSTLEPPDLDTKIDSQGLQQIDWKKEQNRDPNISVIIKLLREGEKPRGEITSQYSEEVQKYLKEWNRLCIKDGILYRNSTLDGLDVRQLVLPESKREVALKGLHDDVGHQGRDKTLWLVKQRFYWPGFESDVVQKVQSCARCTCSKTSAIPSAELVTIESSRPLELVCMDFLSLEKSKGGIEDILVITDHFTRYSVAVPTRNQKAKTTAEALYKHFIIPYSFPERLHSDRGQNFESKVIKELCKMAGVKKSRTTPYHPMGNGGVERFNATLLKMLSSLTETEKSDWKSYVAPLVHAYNATRHESTGFSPHFLMFGWHPRLAIDAYLGLESRTEGGKSRTSYAQKLKKRLQFAYKVASEHSRKKGRKYKEHYDSKVRSSKLEVGDRVLVRNVSVRGKHKIGDKWEREQYVIIDIPNSEIPVYKVQKESGKGPVRTLHRNLLLPFMFIDSSVSENLGKDQENSNENTDSKVLANIESNSDTESSTSEESDVPNYVPVRRSGCRRRSQNRGSSKQIRNLQYSDTSGASTNMDNSHIHNLSSSKGSNSRNSLRSSQGSQQNSENNITSTLSTDSFSGQTSIRNETSSIRNETSSIRNDVSHDSQSNYYHERPRRNRKAPDRYGDWEMYMMNVSKNEMFV